MDVSTGMLSSVPFPTGITGRALMEVMGSSTEVVGIVRATTQVRTPGTGIVMVMP